MHALGRLPSGRNLPLLGLGTFQLKGEESRSAVEEAIKCGYRLIDSAQSYGNEDMVGLAIANCIEQGVIESRDDVFITTKIHPKNNKSEDKCYGSLQASLAKLKLDYVDLVLLHWPGKSGIRPEDEKNKYARRGAWKALIRAKKEGLVIDIGVSNFDVKHLEDPCFKAPSTGQEDFCQLPALDQCECHVACQQFELREYCSNNGIVFQAYSSLCAGQGEVLDHPSFLQAVQLSGMSAHQVLMAWALIEGNIGIIPKSASPKRMKENFDFVRDMLKVLHDTARAHDKSTIFTSVGIDETPSACSASSTSCEPRKETETLITEDEKESEQVNVRILPRECYVLFESLLESGRDVHLAWNPATVS